MSQSPPNARKGGFCALVPGRLAFSRTRRTLALALGSLLIAASSAAEAPEATTSKPSPPTATAPALKPVPPPLLPRTRYTVRKQIESIEPTQWLKRFGKVRIRELKRQESARPR